MISKMKKVRWLDVSSYNNDHEEGVTYLSNELRYINWEYYPRTPFPDSCQLMKLVHLRLKYSLQEKLWKGYKHLPHLKVLQLTCMENLLCTPDFEGLPCLQKLKLQSCDEITEIHPSLGKHTSLEDINISFCEKIRTFPTIVRMEKLKSLEIKTCHESLEFPEIKSNMESLEKLYLEDIGIDALLSSIGERCANLISLHLDHCYYLNINNEVKFDGLKHLEDFRINELRYMKNQLRIHLRHWLGNQLSIWLRPLFPQFSLQKLDLRHCDLRDGEIPSGIGESSNLRELDLSGNNFTRLHFSLSQLTRLKKLDLSHCKELVEIPELPSELTTLYARSCGKLQTLRDCHKNCKRLCKVSLMKGSIINDGSILLESMLQGNNASNMVLEVEGVEIAKGFMPPLVRGSRCRLQLSENWCNEFSGFLICVVSLSYFGATKMKMIKMKSVMSGMESEDEDEDDVVWEESSDDTYKTQVCYISFALLRKTAWWNSTYKVVTFFIERGFSKSDYTKSGVGVRLVARESGTDPTQTLTAKEESEFSRYTPKFSIINDSENALEFLLPIY